MSGETMAFLALGLILAAASLLGAFSGTIWAHKNERDNKKNNPFAWSLDEYKRLSKEERDRLAGIARNANQPFVEEYFRRPKHTISPVDLIVITKYRGNIIYEGDDPGEKLDGLLDRLAEEHQAPVFGYLRHPKNAEACPTK